MRRLARITKDFLDLIGRLRETVEYESPGFKGGRKHLTVVKVADPEDSEDPGYYFARRTGVDSVAVVFYDPLGDADRPFVVLRQFNSPIDKFVVGAFTGSLDKDGKTPAEIVLEECREEAGYDPDPDHVVEVGYAPVSSQTDERVHLFLADVSGRDRDRPEFENIFEESVQLLRMSAKEVFTTCEWKACLILLYAMQKGVLPKGGGVFDV